MAFHPHRSGVPTSPQSPRHFLYLLGALTTTGALALPAAGARAKTFPAASTVARPSAPPAAAARTTTQALPERKVPFVGLRVAPSAQVQVLAPNQAQHDFGTVSALDTPRLEQTFVLSNGGPMPLVLDRLQATCHCTAATIEGAAAGAAPPTLAPGQRTVVRVTVNLAELVPGPLLKSVLVYTRGDQRPAAVLTLIGRLRPAVTLSPALLDFGQITAGKSQTQTLTASLDARLTENGVLPILASSNPDVQITPQPDVIARLKPGLKIRPVPGGRASGAGGLARGLRSRTYRITLTPAAVGPITGSLRFVSSGHDPAASAALATATVLLVGQAVGDIAAQPQALSFGTVRLGQGTIRQVILVGKTAQAMKSLKFASPIPWLSARLVGTDPAALFAAPTPVAAQTNQVLEVTLGPDAPPGALQSRIRVSLADGQCLLIPVTAYVTAGPLL